MLPVSLAFFAFFIAFAIKVPSFPFHTWLPDAHTEAPTAGSVILAGVLLKLGAYGFLRIIMPVFPDAFHHYWWVVALLGVISIVYGALVCMAQWDLKRLIALLLSQPHGLRHARLCGRRGQHWAPHRTPPRWIAAPWRSMAQSLQMFNSRHHHGRLVLPGGGDLRTRPYA